MTTVIVLTALVVSLFATSSLLFNDIFVLQRSLLKETHSLAQVIGENNVGALLFDDNNFSKKSLSSLTAIPHVIEASLFKEDGTLFAQYINQKETHHLLEKFKQVTGLSLFNHYIEQTHQINFDHKVIGKVKIRADFRTIYTRLKWALFIILSVLLGACAIAAFAIRPLHRTISSPILKLANTMDTVSQQQDYSLRINNQNNDEIGVLNERFNEMLSQIQNRDTQLGQANQSQALLINRLGDAQRIAKLGNWEWDPKDDILSLSKQCFHILGLEISEPNLTLNDYLALVHENDREKLKSVLVDCQKQGSSTNLEYRVIQKGGSEIFLHQEIEYISNTDKQKTLLTGTIQDISERKQTERELVDKTLKLEQTNQELDQFAYVASHDLKAPLRAIANLSEWIEEDLVDSINEETASHMALLRGRVRRMEGLIQGILEYSRIGRVSIQNRKVDIAELLEETIDLLPIPPEFQIKVANNLPVLHAPRVPLGQVFSNLIGNAIKYHDRADGQVEITVREDHKFYEFTIADDGPGIAPEYHEKIFTIFQTLAPRDDVESTGIGLSLVKKIVEANGGRITIESEGRGCRFKFTWPMQDKTNDR